MVRVSFLLSVDFLVGPTSRDKGDDVRVCEQHTPHANTTTVESASEGSLMLAFNRLVSDYGAVGTSMHPAGVLQTLTRRSCSADAKAMKGVC